VGVWWVIGALSRVGIAGVAVAVVSVLTLVVGNAFAQKAFDGSRRIEIPRDLLTKADPGRPANYLLIGSDTRAFGESAQDASEFGAAQTQSGQHSDVMMVLHLDPASHRAFLVSFPRDLVVAIPGHGTSLLTDAYNFGGAALTISTIEHDFAPLVINHYVEVDFKGFRDIVNAVGHVDIWFPTAVHDDNTGLAESAGCQALNGDEALAYARSREYNVPANIGQPAAWQPQGQSNVSQGWIEDPLEDIDRIPRQQYFLRTISAAALKATAANPTKLIGLLDAVQSNFVHDQTLKLSELKTLLRTFVGLSPEHIQMSTLPNVPITTGHWSGHLLVEQSAAAPVIAGLSTFAPPAAPTTLPKPAPTSAEPPTASTTTSAPSVYAIDPRFVPLDPTTHGPLIGCPH
jgi:LCP family protein required for cell wall assembly